MSRIPQGARLVGRAAALPPKLSARMVRGSFLLSTRMLRRSLVLSARSVRLAVRSSIASFALGIGVGWFLSTPTGRYVRASILHALRPGPAAPPDDDELAAAVRTELAGAASTWHLPQPEVTVSAGRATLRGSVPHVTGRDALAGAAAGVSGVTEVVDLLVVEPSPAAGAEAEPAGGTATGVR